MYTPYFRFRIKKKKKKIVLKNRGTQNLNFSSVFWKQKTSVIWSRKGCSKVRRQTNMRWDTAPSPLAAEETWQGQIKNTPTLQTYRHRISTRRIVASQLRNEREILSLFRAFEHRMLRFFRARPFRRPNQKKKTSRPEGAVTGVTQFSTEILQLGEKYYVRATGIHPLLEELSFSEGPTTIDT